MRLEAATIANMARAAGFQDRALHVATALALASSGGNTTYHRTAGIAGTGDWRGLWAIDVDRNPDVATWDLYDGPTAAAAAYELTVAAGGFQWSPQYEAGSWCAWEAHCAGESSRYTYSQPATTANTVPVLVRNRDADVRRLRAVVATVADQAKGVRALWPSGTRF